MATHRCKYIKLFSFVCAEQTFFRLSADLFSQIWLNYFNSHFINLICLIHFHTFDRIDFIRMVCVQQICKWKCVCLWQLDFCYKYIQSIIIKSREGRENSFYNANDLFYFPCNRLKRRDDCRGRQTAIIVSVYIICFYRTEINEHSLHLNSLCVVFYMKKK